MKYVFALLFLIFSVSSGARILGVMPFPSYSHQIVFQPLWKELSLRGHQVTTLTTDLINEPDLVNLTEIDLSFAYDIWARDLRKIIVLNQKSFFYGFAEGIRSLINILDEELQNPQIQKLLNDKTSKFDLVMVEFTIPGMFAFATRFNCPLILLSSLDPVSFGYEFIGNPIHPAFDTDVMRPYEEKYTLFGRLKSVLHFLFVKALNTFYYFPANDAFVKKNFGDGYAPVFSIGNNASAFFVNANTVFQKILPLFPNVVQIGGKLHRNDTTQLTKEMKTILDNSKGFIYFSLGGNAKTTDLSLESQKAIMETFSELPYTVLWKLDSDHFSNKPPNVFIMKWFPQQAILKHPKIKLFITQGGRQSIDEAIASNVPMIGLPFYADQTYNVQKMAAQGFGLSLSYVNLKKDEFKHAILEVIKNPKYRNTLKELSDLENDQPMTGLERALWWTEYVLRHKGAKHLRSPYLDVPLYQYLLLDVFGVCLLVIVVATFVLLLSLINLSSGAKILGVMPFPSYSHQIVFQPLWKELSLRGHQVTTLTTDPINDPTLVNLTEIDLSFTYKIWTECLRKIIVVNQENIFTGFVQMLTCMLDFIDKQLESRQVQDLLHDENLKFDLVILEYAIPAVCAFAARFNCPHIGVSSLDPPSFVYEFIGNPIHPVFDTDILRPYEDKHTLFGRLKSFLHVLSAKLLNEFYYLPATEALIKKHFGDNYPPMTSIANNASALFLNSNTVFQKILPLLPNVVQIGGKLHRNDIAQLTEEMRMILEKSKGFIYFSLGSNAKSTDIPPQTQKAMIETFSELPYTVFWKFDSDHFPNKSANVFISKWFPQQAILRHSKIKLFVTQGGRQSMDEAIASNVPMIGIPFYGDQLYNVQKMVAQGYGLSLDYVNLQKDEFKSAILEVIKNPKYRNTLKLLSDLEDDQPMTGLQRAIWWTEYVLRHKGAKHLRSPYLEISLYQYLLLDVLGRRFNTSTYFYTRKLFNGSYHVKEQNKQILNYLTQQKEKQQSSPFPVLPELPTQLPINTEQDLIGLNQLLTESPDRNSALCTYLRTLGGKDITNKTNRILKYILTDEVAQNYNYFGKRSKKKAFCELQLNDVIIRAVKAGTNCNNNEVEGLIKVWLKHAPERLKAIEK
ncbi:hypothetical protein RN001_015174 [Aquatica leii]|uniref:DUF4806 domain-containing protein n=1 Tax=Aquatica leii TaxID=1421715 RepID=A0AAN7NVC0_9COLE|nr:hypothetical protein RN001_015174 [Aquatica leii]